MIVAMIQARLRSSRLPHKTLLPLTGEPLIAHVLRNATRMNVDDVVLLLPETEGEVLSEWGKSFGAQVLRGPLTPLFRFWDAIATLKLQPDDYVVRICAGSPAHYPEQADFLIEDTYKNRASYGTFVTPDGYPAMQTRLGGFVEVIKVETLLHASSEEHVTYDIYAGGGDFYCRVMPSDLIFYGATMTIDTRDEYSRVNMVMNKIGGTPKHYKDVVNVFRQNPVWRDGKINKPYDGWKYGRNEESN